MSPQHDDVGTDGATLGGVSGRGYGVVESLPSLGKGRRLTGIFRALPTHGARLRADLAARTRLRFEGMVHFRHHSVRAAVEVEIARVEEADEEVVVELSAYDVPYSLG